MAAVDHVPITAAPHPPQLGWDGVSALVVRPTVCSRMPARPPDLQYNPKECSIAVVYDSCPLASPCRLQPCTCDFPGLDSRLTPCRASLTALLYLLTVLDSSAITILVLRVSSRTTFFSFLPHTLSHVSCRRALTNSSQRHITTARYCLRRDSIPLDSDRDATDRAT